MTRKLAAIAAAIAVLLAAGITAAATRHDATRTVAGSTAATTTSAVGPVPATAVAPAPPPPRAPTGPVALAGCPLAPRPARPPGPPGWRPAVLVAEESLPVAADPAPWPSDPGAVLGKGMWTWKIRRTEAGDADAIVRRAKAAGLHQLWVRVGDSQDRFYGASVLADLVPRAHRAGIAVIGWGFPYLWDPASDAAWAKAALDWKGPGGERLDGFSPDIETSAEGVVITERRVSLYLSLVRAAAGSRPVVATVLRPTDRYWLGSYPYRAMAKYVDAFAPMVYWGCTDPGAAVGQALERLRTLRPVHVIGQGYDMSEDGGRLGAPSREETLRFLDVAERDGAIGVSFWVWQSMPAHQWATLEAFPWRQP